MVNVYEVCLCLCLVVALVEFDSVSSSRLGVVVVWEKKTGCLCAWSVCDLFVLCVVFVVEEEDSQCGIRTHALSDQCLKLAP